MSVRIPPDGFRRDDELLDRLGRGDPVDGGENGGVDGGEVERMLSSWRASMPTAGPTDERLLDAVAAAVTRPRARRRATRVTAAAAAAVLLVGGGVTAAAAQAGPGSPLWPVTRLVYTGLAESRAATQSADHALSQARTALDQGRYPDATRLLARADELAARVDEPAVADRLHDDIDAVRALLRRDAGPLAHTDATISPTATPNAPAAPAPPAATSGSEPDEPPRVDKRRPSRQPEPTQPAPARPQPTRDPGPPADKPRTDVPGNTPTGLLEDLTRGLSR